MTSGRALPSAAGARQRKVVAWRGWRWLGVLLAVVLWLAVGVALYGNAFVRTRMEGAINAQLKGYTVTLPRLHLNLFGFSVILRDVTITQDAHPKPAIAHLESLEASVDWRALLHARMVATFTFDEPEVYVNLTHFRIERDDKTKLSERGWQRAAEEIYPLKINRILVRNGNVTYVDNDPKRPMKLERLYMNFENIRNVRSAEGTYPSPLHIQAQVFESGRVELTGKADFFAEPVAAINTDFAVQHVPLAAVKPVAEHANLKLTGGVLSAKGHVEYAPKVQDVRVESVVLDGLHVDYVHSTQTETKEEKNVDKATEIAHDVSNEPQINVAVDDLHLTDADFAFVDTDQHYRVSLDDTDLRVRGISSHATPNPASLMIKGRFMGEGTAVVSSQFRPVNKKPEFTLTLQIEDTPLTAMNDLFRAYGNFDVVGGKFAFYSELEARNGKINGYVKPLFTDMDVYALEQDASKPILNQVYEGLVGSVAGLLRNPRDDVATRANVSGRIDQPNVSTLQIVLRLIGNAFFNSILPGFEDEAHRVIGEKAKPE
jgi:hypothetical protein